MGKSSTLLATATTSGATITHVDTESIQNYRFIYVEGYISSTMYVTRLIPVCMIVLNKSFEMIENASATYSVDVGITFVSNTTTKFAWNIAGWSMTSLKIYGIK